MTDFLFNAAVGAGAGADGHAATNIILAHGAGASMDSPFMDAFAAGLAARGLGVARFEFPYMARRRADGGRRRPDRAPALVECWAAVVEELGPPGRLIIGGKSLGGRMASLLAADLERQGTPVAALVGLGYPFHAPGKIPGDRISHLAGLTTPTIILQGTRDALGCHAEVEGYDLSPAIEVVWLEDGDHDLKPRKKSDRTVEQNWTQAQDAIAAFAARI